MYVIVGTNTITLYYVGILVLVKGQHDTTPVGSYKQVAAVEDFFDILHQAHYNDTGHSGAKKTLAKASPADSDILCTQHLMQCSLYTIQVQALYSCLPRAAMDKFASLCSVCQRMVPQSHREPLKPIIAKGFMQRGQVGGKKDGP